MSNTWKNRRYRWTTWVMVRCGGDRWALQYIRHGILAGWVTLGTEDVKIEERNAAGQLCMSRTARVKSIAFTDNIDPETFHPAVGLWRYIEEDDSAHW